MEKDYASIIPEPPDDLVDYAKKHGNIKRGWLIYKCGHRKNEQTGKSEDCLDAVCTECQAHFKPDRTDKTPEPSPCCSAYGPPPGYGIRGKLGNKEIVSGEDIKCPACGASLTCSHSGLAHGVAITDWPLVFSKVDGKVIAASYRIMKTSKKDGSTKISVDKYEAYVFDGKKALRCTAVNTVFYSKSYTGIWKSRKRFEDKYYCCDMLYPLRGILRNTQFKNCRLKEYLRTENAIPISYLKAFSRWPQIENLLTHGCYNALEIIVKADTDYKDILNIKEKSPRKILGVSKPDFEYVKNLNLRQLKFFKALRVRFPAVPATRLLGLSVGFIYRGEALLKDIDKYGIKFINYLCRIVEKKQYENENAAYTDWQDYLAAAKNLGYDTKDANALFPRNLKAAHDNAIKARKYKEDEKLREQFKEQFQKLQPLAWENSDFIIRPAASEHELIVEGKILSHCVGGYGRSHCNDSPIFFVRRAGAPGEPYFTLQLSLANKRVMQNRGKNNCAPPPEVNDFVALWMQEVVTKPKTKKRHSKKSDAA